MNLKDIQELIKFVAKSGATEVDLEIDNIKISIKSPAKKRRGVTEEPITVIQQAPAQAVVAPPVPAPIEPTKKEVEKQDENANYVTIKASMIGTFYRSSGSDKDAFVNVGDEIKTGSVICIIEAMKLFNEIESEISGKIVKVLVDDNTPVEFDQPLFLVDPS
ncbi:MAG: acetyl-CoA carboxylase biotin carboxyl carrier protein [Flavobacteriales bacterium]|nr:acetyl-CoA carboxylase biotin carboxyl carrier protein [Flavobacteriales bacterium]